MPGRPESWTRRRLAARPYQPKRIRLLLVAESPPADGSYFYFDDGKLDALFEEVCTVLFEEKPAGDRIRSLKELRRRGVFVTELKPDAPRKRESLASYVAPFLLNAETLAPEHVLLIGADVFEAAHAAAKKAGLPVLPAKIPSPSAGTEFRQKLRQALVRAGLEKLIRPLPSGAGRSPGGRPKRSRSTEAGAED